MALSYKNEMKDGCRKLFIKLTERSLKAANVYQAAEKTGRSLTIFS